MSSSDDLIRQARAAVYPLPSSTPRSRRTILTCMDTRIDPLAALGLALGDAHVLRNAGGIVTGDVIRSLIVSQRTLGTNRIDVMMHTECGMLRLDEPALRAAITVDTGVSFDRSFGSFADLETELRRGVDVLRGTAALADVSHVRGFVLDVGSGHTRLVVS